MRTPNVSSVLVRGFREVGETVVRIINEHRVTVHRSDLVELFRARNLCLHLTWPGSQTSRCRCGVAYVLRFQDGKLRQECGLKGDIEVDCAGAAETGET